MVEIVKIDESDLPDLVILFEELIESKCDLANVLTNFKWIKQNEDYIVLGAKSEGKIVGSLTGIICHDLVGDCKPFMVIENVIVLSRYRGQGIGKKLMAEIERTAKVKDCNYTMFVSSSKRKDAHKFYESLGNVSDGNKDEWRKTIQSIDTNNYDLIIPGHGKYGGIELIKHTISILNQ